MVYPEINLWQEWCISVKEHVTVYQIWPQALCLEATKGHTCCLCSPSFRQCILVPWPPSCDRHDKNGDCFHTLRAASAVTAAWSFAKLSEYAGVFIDKVRRFDSNLCLGGWTKNVFFPMKREKVSLAIFQHIEVSFDQKAARSTAMTSAQPKPCSLQKDTGKYFFPPWLAGMCSWGFLSYTRRILFH